jgi:hypothetical protein
MIPGRILRATRTLGPPKDWDVDRDGPCASLPVRDEAFCGFASMVSAWHPTPAEILAICGGAPVYLRIVSSQHPAIELTVGPAAEEVPELAGGASR